MRALCSSEEHSMHCCNSGPRVRRCQAEYVAATSADGHAES